MEPYSLTATDALSQIRAGAFSPVDWVASCLERIRLREPEIQAWAHLNPQAPEDAGHRWRNGQKVSIPLGVKDIIDVVGMPSMLGTDFHSPQPATREGGSVSILRDAGCVVVGKTVTTELGHMHPGPTRNPHHLLHTPGGSSSGSAAAVADQMVPLCLGTQTSGSVIRPAAYCGIIGYKPTYNDFDKSGILPNAPSMDTLGIMARSVEDVWLLRRILLEEAGEAPRPVQLGDLRIGLLKAPPWEGADDETRGHLEAFASSLAARGARLVELSMDAEITRLQELHRLISGYEFRRSIAHERIHHFDRLSAILREGRLADGNQVSNAAYQAAIQETAALRLLVAQHFARVDLLITPSAAGPAPATLAATGSPPLTRPGPWRGILPSPSHCSGHGSRACPSGASLSPGLPMTSCCLGPRCV